MYKKSVLLFLLGLLFISGCGQTSEERNEEWKKERAERSKQEELEKKKNISKLEARFNALYFPPLLGEKYYTYQVQQFIESNAGKNLLFAGYLQDITLSANKYILHFVVKVADSYPETIIRFRISTNEINVKNLSISEGKKPITYSTFFDDPEYYVVAQIEEVKSVTTYKYNGSSLGEEEFEIDTDLSLNLIANGQLIEVSKFNYISESKL